MKRHIERIIVFITLTSFIFSNLLWAADNLAERDIAHRTKDSLAPSSEFFNKVSAIDIETASIGQYIIREIIRYNIASALPISNIADLYLKLIQRNERNIRSDLKENGVHILSHPNRIEFVSREFVLTFMDRNCYSGKFFKSNMLYEIPGTKIVVNIYRHGLTHILAQPRPVTRPVKTGLQPPTKLLPAPDSTGEPVVGPAIQKPKIDIWQAVSDAETQAKDSFLDVSKIDTIADVGNFLGDKQVKPNPYMVIKAEDREIIDFIKSIPNLDMENTEVVIYRIKGTDFWIVIKGEAGTLRFKNEIIDLGRKGLLVDFFYFQGFLKGPDSAYLPSVRDLKTSLMFGGMITMIGKDGVLQYDVGAFEINKWDLWKPSFHSTMFAEKWKECEWSIIEDGKLNPNPLQTFGILANFLPTDKLDTSIFQKTKGAQELLGSQKSVQEVVGLGYLWRLLEEDAVEFISDYIKGRDAGFRNIVFEWITGAEKMSPSLIKLLFVFLYEEDMFIRLKALKIIYGAGLIEKKKARNIIREVIGKCDRDEIERIRQAVGHGRWEGLLADELGEQRSSLPCAGRVSYYDKDWSPFIVKEGITGPEIRIEDGIRKVFLDGELKGTISPEEWELIKYGKESAETKEWIGEINKLMIKRIVEYVDGRGDFIGIECEESGVKLTAMLEKKLLEELFDGREDMDEAAGVFIELLADAVHIEMRKGTDFTQFDVKKPIQFVLVDKYFYLGGDKEKNGIVILNRGLKEVKKKDRAVFDAFIEMIIANELGFYEIGDISSGDIVTLERGRFDIDVLNFFIALRRRGKTYIEAHKALGRITGSDSRLLGKLEELFFREKSKSMVVESRKIADLFKEVVEKNLGGDEILELFLRRDPNFSQLLDAMDENLEAELRKLSEKEDRGELDNYIYWIAWLNYLLGLPPADELSKTFSEIPNLARALGLLYRMTVPDELKREFELEMELVAWHAYRVTRIALLIARRLKEKGFPVDEKILLLACLLHDLGKGPIIDIISSPRKLTDDEFRKVNKHAEETIKRLNKLLDILNSGRYKLTKEVSDILCTNVKLREAMRHHHTPEKIESDEKGRLIGELLMAADVLDALLDASRAYILQGGDVKSLNDALDILRGMKDRIKKEEPPPPLIRNEIIQALEELYKTGDKDFMGLITDTHKFPILYNALVLATILPKGLNPGGHSILNTAKTMEDRRLWDTILNAIANSNLDIRRKVGFVRKIEKIAKAINGYKEDVLRGGISIETVSLDRLLFINSDLRLDLSKEARERIEHNGVVILSGARKEVIDAYKVILQRLKSIGKTELERNMLLIEMDEEENINVVSVKRIIASSDKDKEFLSQLSKGSLFQEVLNTLFGSDSWVYQPHFEEVLQRELNKKIWEAREILGKGEAENAYRLIMDILDYVKRSPGTNLNLRLTMAIKILNFYIEKYPERSPPIKKIIEVLKFFKRNSSGLNRLQGIELPIFYTPPEIDRETGSMVIKDEDGEIRWAFDRNGNALGYIMDNINRILLKLSEEVDKIIAGKEEWMQGMVKKDIADALRILINNPQTPVLGRILAWQLLVKMGECKEPNGVVIYSLADFLQSKPGIEGDISLMQRIIRQTEGKVYFYVGVGCETAKGYEFLEKGRKTENCIITADELKTMEKDNKILVYMLNDLDRKDLELDALDVGELVGNKVVIPLQGQREPERDILLGLEVVRVLGVIDNIPSIFRQMLEEMIREYLIQQGEKPTKQRIRTIYESEPKPKEIDDSYEEIINTIISA